MISYYDLLDMIQDGDEPQLIVLRLNCGSMEYQPVYDGGEFSHYEQVAKNHQSENFKFYLSDTLLESQMIEPNIEIIENEYIEELSLDNSYSNTKDQLQAIEEKINEIIKIVNKLTIKV